MPETALFSDDLTLFSDSFAHLSFLSSCLLCLLVLLDRVPPLRGLLLLGTCVFCFAFLLLSHRVLRGSGSNGLSLPFDAFLLAQLPGSSLLRRGTLLPLLFMLSGRLLGLAFLEPTARWLAARIRLRGPRFTHPISLRQRLSPNHGGLDTLLASHHTALLTSARSLPCFRRPASSPW